MRLFRIGICDVKLHRRDLIRVIISKYVARATIALCPLAVTNAIVTTAAGSATIVYDANGNRTSFAPYGTTDTYTSNNLNQYTQRNGFNAAHDNNGNLITGVDGSSYTYDAQNRLTSAYKGGTTESFAYDGLSRQVSRTLNGTTTYNVYDGWDLIDEFQAGAPLANYVYGAGGLLKDTWTQTYFYQDGSGSTSHLADNGAHLLEWYRYDLQGTPVFYNAANTQIPSTNYAVRHLFTGQQWYSEIGLYDLRNRFYSPDIGRFLQPDPIGFNGDATSLYRYCGNNPVTFGDPLGLWTFQIGLAINVQAGPSSWSYSRGIAFDVSGNLVQFRTGFGGVGAGARWSGGIAFAASNADTVFGLERDYKVFNGGGGAGASGTGQFFWGRDAVNRKFVWGMGVTVGPGLGGGGSGGVSLTNVWPVGSPSHGAPPTIPADHARSADGDPYAGYIDTSNGTAVYEDRVTVSGTPSQGWSPFTPQYAPYAASLCNFKGTGISSLSNPFGSWGEPTGGPIGNWKVNGQLVPTSIFGVGNYYSGLDPISDFGHIYEGNPVGIGEPGLGCFVAGTPVLMADGSEKPIDRIQAGEAVVAWNDQTRETFQTRVIKPLHHEAKAQTLFDIELENGRRLTVNNNHPIYVIEDDEFILSRELAARFANGQRITFQDSQGQPIRVANIHMRRQICKVYNLEVEGQGKNGHTYYADGVLVHNTGRYAFK